VCPRGKVRFRHIEPAKIAGALICESIGKAATVGLHGDFAALKFWSFDTAQAIYAEQLGALKMPGRYVCSKAWVHRDMARHRPSAIDESNQEAKAYSSARPFDLCRQRRWDCQLAIDVSEPEYSNVTKEFASCT